MSRIDRYRLIDVSTGASSTFSAADGTFTRVADSDGGGADDAVVALVPADRCSLVRVEIPEMSAARMNKALRWAVEDSIAGDPEMQHVVPVRRTGDGKLLCLVVAREDMNRWLAALPRRPQRMVPDAACLPHAPGEVVMMPAGDQVLARAGEAVFDRMEPDLLDDLVPELVEGQGARARLVWLGDAPPDPIRRFDPEVRLVKASLLEVLAPGALGAFGADTNLLAGEYAAPDQPSAGRQWRMAGWLAGLAVFLLLAGVVVDFVMLKREQLRLEQVIESRFDDMFPQITTLVRPRAQAERALAELRGGSRDRFVQLMSAVSPLFSGAEGVQVDSIRYADDTLELDLETSSLSDLEALQRQLRAQGIDAALRDVEVMAGATRGRMRIAEAR